MQVVLVMFRSDGGRKSFSVTRDVVVVGRREDCDLRIPLGEVSRKHCRFVKDGEALRIEDLGSSNGTFVNGERVQEALVNAGDTVQVGPVMFVVQIDGVPAEDEMNPTPRAAAAEGGAAATAGATLDEGEFDPIAALESADQSGFEFSLDETQPSPEDSANIDLEESKSDPNA
jgi:predicted component of type VI protein secretion system